MSYSSLIILSKYEFDTLRDKPEIKDKISNMLEYTIELFSNKYDELLSINTDKIQVQLERLREFNRISADKTKYIKTLNGETSEEVKKLEEKYSEEDKHKDSSNNRNRELNSTPDLFYEF